MRGRESSTGKVTTIETVAAVIYHMGSKFAAARSRGRREARPRLLLLSSSQEGKREDRLAAACGFISRLP